MADVASPMLMRVCVAAPDEPGAWLALARALDAEGDGAGAAEAFAAAAGLAPDAVAAALQRAEAALAEDAGGAELARLEAVLADDPLCVASHVARGFLLERAGRRDDAIDALEAAVALAPEHSRPAVLRAALLARSGRLADAEAALRRARVLDPDNAMVANDLAAVLMRLYRPAEARALLAALVEAGPPDVHVMCNLVGATTVLGLQDEAVAEARRAITAFPGSMAAWRALCNALPYADGTTGRVLQTALRTCARLMPRGAPHRFDNVADPRRRLRVGLLSGSLREHPVGWLTVAGFEALDPAAFELVAFAQAEATDALARRFRAVCTEWHPTVGLDDAALSALARARGIDVLVELGGHGDNARLPACAHRLAPVQVKWVGMQYHGTGMAEMDWFVTDRWETPETLAGLYSERLMCLPDGYVCYSPPGDAPDVAPPPALARGFVTFGCFNNLAKLSPACVEAWCRVLRRVPTARMVLKTQALGDAGVRARVLSWFAAHGVPAERVALRPGSPHRAFLAQYNDIDVVLDPFPYSGGLTTCEALWMGVPTVTLPGETFASRHSASHLSNVGLADWLAADVDAYVARAVRAAGDVAGLAALRTGLRETVRRSPLCDAPRFGRGFGAALRHAWVDWCERQGRGV